MTSNRQIRQGSFQVGGDTFGMKRVCEISNMFDILPAHYDSQPILTDSLNIARDPPKIHCYEQDGI